MTKVWPKEAVFIECGQCGHWHARELPGSVDCRDDAHRFPLDDLDHHYGSAGWEEIMLDEQEANHGH